MLRASRALSVVGGRLSAARVVECTRVATAAFHAVIVQSSAKPA
jgi:hypothetical protein